MVPIIVFLIYIILLRNLEGEMLISALKDYGLIDATGWKIPGMEHDCFTMMDFWMLSGLLGISAITISIQSNNIMVNDKENGVNRDFISSPVNPKILITSYFIFNFLVTLLLCFIFFLICLIYIAAMGEFVLTFLDILTILGVLIITCLSSTLITIFICAFINREPTLASIIAIFSSAAGFLVGAYMPFGLFPGWVEAVCCFIPLTHNVALLRFAFLNGVFERFQQTYEPLIEDKGVYDALMSKVDQFGYNLHFFGDNVANPSVSAIIVACSIVVFAALSLWASRFITNMERR